MKCRLNMLLCLAGLLISGCVSESPGYKNYLEQAPLVPENGVAVTPPVLFPDYFLSDDLELHDHGHIPRTGLIGAGLSSALELSEVRSFYADQLYYHQWETEKMEVGRQFSRIVATHEKEKVEIRMVCGSSGPTQVFLLYTPKVD